MFQQTTESVSPKFFPSISEREISEDFFFDSKSKENQVSLSPDHSSTTDHIMSSEANLLSDLSCLTELIDEGQLTTEGFGNSFTETEHENILHTELDRNLQTNFSWPDNSEVQTRQTDYEISRKRRMNYGEQEVSKNLNKAALQAKINREKKKKYMKELEEQNSFLQKENSILKTRERKFEETLRILRKEVLYLRSVLENESQLAKIIKNLDQPVRLTKAFEVSKRAVDGDHEYAKPSNIKRKAFNNGICLHVKNDEITMEFCRECSDISNFS